MRRFGFCKDSRTPRLHVYDEWRSERNHPHGVGDALLRVGCGADCTATLGHWSVASVVR